MPFINDRVAEGLTKDLLKLPLPEYTELVDYISCAGKLTGNGDGMQYFGAILIQSELSEDELKRFYEQYSENGRNYFVEKQNDSRIKAIENRKVFFNGNFDNKNYFIIYSWGDGDCMLSNLDLRSG